MANPPSRTYLLLEERLGSPLADHVRSLRAEGRSWNRIAADLHERTTVLVTAETVRIWFASTDATTHVGAA